jgi:hypothetical protein
MVRDARRQRKRAAGALLTMRERDCVGSGKDGDPVFEPHGEERALARVSNHESPDASHSLETCPWMRFVLNPNAKPDRIC